jgi:hypothetical protein
MVSMNKLIISAFFCLFSVLAQAEVQLQIESTEVSRDEPFQISLIQNNPQVGVSIPDLTLLRKDFFILGTTRSLNYSIIDGKTQSSSTWAITLKALKSGTFTIPSIKIGKEQTKPLTITVTDSAKPNTSLSNSAPDTPQEDIFLTTHANENKPYVNQQIIYKVSLYNSKQLLDASYQGPKVDNALLIPLGSEKRYQTQKNGLQYLVEEQSYAIFPQKSGSLKITSPVFTALVYSFEPQRIKATDKPITLEVQPIPKDYTGTQWLPAKQIRLIEKYEHKEHMLTQGNTLVRRIRLEGVGIPAQLLPTLNFAQTDSFSVYTEKGKEKNQIIQGELVSSAEIKVTYLFNKSGTITLPELKLPWFNTTKGKEETATLASKNLEITPSVSKSLPSKAELSISKTHSYDLPQKQNYWAWILASFFALAWLITLSLWGWQKRSRTLTNKGAYKKALDELHRACIQNKAPKEARDALLKWARLHWPDAPLLTLNELTQLINSEQLKKQIHILSQALYQNSQQNSWQGDELWHNVQTYKRSSVTRNKKTEVLPPINPH